MKKKLLFIMFMVCISISASPDNITPVKTTCNPSTVAENILSQNVQCCCRTHNGGTCCAMVYVCSDYVPGCICSYRQKDEKNQLSLIEMKLNKKRE